MKSLGLGHKNSLGLGLGLEKSLVYFTLLSLPVPLAMPCEKNGGGYQMSKIRQIRFRPGIRPRCR